MNRSLSLAYLLLAAQMTSAQDALFVPFKAAPLTINPAFTGMFNGNLRVAAAYQNDWQTATVPFATAAVGADMPIVVTKKGNYLAGGIQFVKLQAGDGNLQSADLVASLAWHARLGKPTKDHSRELAVGIQGGYANHWVDIYKLHLPQNQQYYLGIGNSVSYYKLNAGICYSQAVNNRLNYTVGVAGHNLNQPADEADKRKAAGLSPVFTTTAGANWVLSTRLTLQPAILYREQNGHSSIDCGTELQYTLKKSKSATFSPYIFAGAWYRTGDMLTITLGTGFKAFRLAAGYNYSLISPGSAAGGFLVQCSYIAPRRIATPSVRIVPCDRF